MDRYIDYKYSVWGRIYLPEEVSKEQALELVKSGMSGNEIYDEIVNKHIFVEPTFELLHDTEQQISVEENDGMATIEYYEGQEVIYANGKTL